MAASSRRKAPCCAAGAFRSIIPRMPWFLLACLLGRPPGKGNVLATVRGGWLGQSKHMTRAAQDDWPHSPRLRCCLCPRARGPGEGSRPCPLATCALLPWGRGRGRHCFWNNHMLASSPCKQREAGEAAGTRGRRGEWWRCMTTTREKAPLTSTWR